MVGVAYHLDAGAADAGVLEDFIQCMYAETKTLVAAHPFGASSDVVEN